MRVTTSGTILAIARAVAKRQSHANNGLIRVVIETPRGSRNKYAYDAQERAFVLKKVLPAGMAFPYDFGFVPGTRAEDGDPLDVLVLMDEPAFAGCIVECRVIGVLEGKQKEGRKSVRNDRLIAVEESNRVYADVKRLDELGDQFVHELEKFFENYSELYGKDFKVARAAGPDEAYRRIRQVQG